MTAADAELGGLERTVPWWALRVATGAVGLGTAGAVGVWASAEPFVLILVAGLAVASAIVPGSHLPATFLAACCVLVLAGADGVTGWTAVTIAGMHATHLLAALAAVVPRDAAIERSALRPTAERFVPVQLATQLLVVLTWLITRA